MHADFAVFQYCENNARSAIILSWDHLMLSPFWVGWQSWPGNSQQKEKGVVLLLPPRQVQQELSPWEKENVSHPYPRQEGMVRYFSQCSLNHKFSVSQYSSVIVYFHDSQTVDVIVTSGNSKQSFKWINEITHLSIIRVLKFSSDAHKHRLQLILWHGIEYLIDVMLTKRASCGHRIHVSLLFGHT